MSRIPFGLGWAAIASLAATILFATSDPGRSLLLLPPLGAEAPAAVPAPPRGFAPPPLPAPRLNGAWVAYVAPTGACPGGDDQAAPVATQERTMLCLINWARARRGVGQLEPSSLLRASASLKAADVVRCNRFEHDPCGTPMRGVFDSVGYGRGATSVSFSENLAMVSSNGASPRYVLNGWLNSDGHRENLFAPEWTEQGVALLPNATLEGASGVNVWASHFGVRR